MKKLSVVLGGAASLLVVSIVPHVFADPVDEELQIDGVQISTVAPAPKEPPGHPFEQVKSGWLYREAETRAFQEDSFENPGMLSVERGAELWKTADGAAGKSCSSCHGDAEDSMKASAPLIRSGTPKRASPIISNCRSIPAVLRTCRPNPTPSMTISRRT